MSFYREYLSLISATNIILISAYSKYFNTFFLPPLLDITLDPYLIPALNIINTLNYQLHDIFHTALT